jgi:hypothetical protein
MNNDLISTTMAAFLEAKQTATSDPDWTSPCSSGLIAAKNAAIQECEKLSKKVQGLVNLDSAAVFLLGPPAKQQEFAEIAEDEADAIVIDAQEFYKVVADFVEPHLGKDRSWLFGCNTALLNVLRMLGNQLGLLYFTLPNSSTLAGNVVEDMQATIKGLIRGVNGDDFNAAYLANTVYGRVMQSEYEGDVVMVVVLNADEEEAKGDLAAKLFSGRTLHINVGKKSPDKNDVIVLAKKMKPMFERVAGIMAAKRGAPQEPIITPQEETAAQAEGSQTAEKSEATDDKE